MILPIIKVDSMYYALLVVKDQANILRPKSV